MSAPIAEDRRVVAIVTARPSRPADAPSLPVAEPAAIPLGLLLRRAGAAVRSGIPDAVWVVAAVAAVKAARSGVSLELVEPEVSRAETGLLRAYMPESVVAALGRQSSLAIEATDLVGMTVTLRLSVELSPRWGLSGRVERLGPGVEVSLARRALEATIAKLTREGLLQRQRSLPVPRDVTHIAVVHPAAAAGWADISGELARWAAAGLIMTRSVPAPFEGAEAAGGIAAALRRAAEPIGGHLPDLLILVRGGGATASLGALDSENLARVIATLPVPVVTGLGHAIDLTLADRVAWRSVDTPSKTLALVRETLVAPARRARADHQAILVAVSSGLARAEPSLRALERRLAGEVLRQATAASERLDRVWAGVRAAAEAGRERLERTGDGLMRLLGDVEAMSPLLLERVRSELEALHETVRTRARQGSGGADDGARHVAAVTMRAEALVGVAVADLAALDRALPAAALARADFAVTEIDAAWEAVRRQVRERIERADPGDKSLRLIEAAVAAGHQAHGAAIERQRDTIETAVLRRVDAAAAALERISAALDGADPAEVLRLGYALVLDPSGRPITNLAAAQAAASLTIRFADGDLAVRKA